jgi:serine/threonine protein kinase
VSVSDGAIERLRRLADWPDFTATRYTLVEDIGRGGMGIVFRARDGELDREVAIKVTAWPTASDTGRLRREARTLASLEHAGIIPIHDVGVLPDGRVFFVMSLVRGERLDIHAASLPLADRLRLFDRVCDTVAFAHSHGIVHRDLTPANILVGPFGQVQIVDWGLAGGAEPGGTAGYMPPEEGTRPDDIRIDVFALGSILRGMGAEDAKPLASVIGRATAADAESRYANVPELAAEVRRFVDGHAVLAHHETAIERAARLGRTYRTPIALVVTYLAMRIILLWWGR